MTPEDGLAAVFEGPGRPFRLVGYPLRAPGPGTILVRVLLSSICGSDVHAWTGRRAFPVPGILGHEIVGVIEAVGPSAPPDLRGRTLGPGQRVIWTEYVACGACLPCRVLDLPQKCAQVRKYGHERSTEPPHLLGGLAEYCYLLPGTGVLLVPDPISDAEVAPVSCGVATIAAVIEAAAIDRGDAVVVQGAGLLGLYAIAMARAVGAASVVALEAVPSRQALARRFGADAVLDPTTLDAHALGAGVRAYAPRGGADVVIETCGVPVALPQGLSVLRVGGRLVTAGLVVPGATVTLDASEIVRRCIIMRGVHNYHPRHLVRALDFVTDHCDRLPLGALVDATFPLAAADGAFVAAAERRALRPAVVP